MGVGRAEEMLRRMTGKAMGGTSLLFDWFPGGWRRNRENSDEDEGSDEENGDDDGEGDEDEEDGSEGDEDDDEDEDEDEDDEDRSEEEETGDVEMTNGNDEAGRSSASCLRQWLKLYAPRLITSIPT